MNIRKAAVSGGFYPEGDACREMVKEFLDKATRTISPKIRGIVSPHAGYVFSGLCAGWGYKQIEGEDYKTVIILGISHQYPINNSVISSFDGYETPLGTASINKEMVEKIMELDKDVSHLPQAEAREHSIEVLIPFIQVILPEAKIVPILVSGDEKGLSNLAIALSKVIDDDTLIVASSDLSHYPGYSDAKMVDKETIEKIVNFDEKGLIEAEMNVYSSGIPGLATYLCGFYPVLVLIKTMKILGIDKAKEILYYNSGDTPYGEKDRVVGYGSICFYKEGYLTNKEKERLLFIARETLNLYLKDGKIPEFKEENPKMLEKSGVFVTLHTKEGHLRGCIGYILPIKPLYQAIIDNAISAAVSDYRFPQVTYSELASLKIELSVLTPPKKIGTYTEIILGKHGIVLSKSGRSAVFLPQVAPEQKWTLEETLTHLSLKAGLPSDAWKKDCQFEVFEAEVFGEE
ncbi:MAG: AmmeMemoRadiSam system protein B [bacterium]